MAKEKPKEPQAEPARFSKEKIRNMARYSSRKDLLGALLKDGVEYTLAEADAAVRTFMEGV